MEPQKSGVGRGGGEEQLYKLTNLTHEILDEAACACTIERFLRHLACPVLFVMGATNPLGKVINGVLHEFSRGPNGHSK